MPSLDWHFVGFGDFNGDKARDMVWRHANGDVAIWIAAGQTSTKTTVGTMGPLLWQIIGIKDINADGRDDIIWRNTQSGEVQVWIMNGGSIAYSGSYE